MRLFKMQYQKISIILLILILLFIIGGCEDDSSGPGEGSSNTITLVWVAPTTNEDGTPLTAIAGYRVYYMGENADYEEDVGIPTCQDNGGLTECTVTIENLSSGRWCFAVTAYDTSVKESDYSNEVCIYIS